MKLLLSFLIFTSLSSAYATIYTGIDEQGQNCQFSYGAEAGTLRHGNKEIYIYDYKSDIKFGSKANVRVTTGLCHYNNPEIYIDLSAGDGDLACNKITHAGDFFLGYNNEVPTIAQIKITPKGLLSKWSGKTYKCFIKKIEQE